jgi:hypothetical protein
MIGAIDSFGPTRFGDSVILATTGATTGISHDAAQPGVVLGRSRGKPTEFEKLPRRSTVTTTLGLHLHAPNEDRMTAQSDLIAAFFAPISLQKRENRVGEGVKGSQPIYLIFS